MSRADHCVLQTGGLLCSRCQERYAIAWPISARMLAAISRAFVQEHRGCRPKTPTEVEHADAQDRVVDAEMRLSDALHVKGELERKLLKLEDAVCSCGGDWGGVNHGDECRWIALLRKAGLA